VEAEEEEPDAREAEHLALDPTFTPAELRQLPGPGRVREFPWEPFHALRLASSSAARRR
jgi:hypothetical protein